MLQELLLVQLKVDVGSLPYLLRDGLKHHLVFPLRVVTYHIEVGLVVGLIHVRLVRRTVLWDQGRLNSSSVSPDVDLKVLQLTIIVLQGLLQVICYAKELSLCVVSLIWLVALKSLLALRDLIRMRWHRDLLLVRLSSFLTSFTILPQLTFGLQLLLQWLVFVYCHNEATGFSRLTWWKKGIVLLMHILLIVLLIIVLFSLLWLRCSSS